MAMARNDLQAQQEAFSRSFAASHEMLQKDLAAKLGIDQGLLRDTHSAEGVGPLGGQSENLNFRRRASTDGGIGV
jgi:hypothetical protein